MKKSKQIKLLKERVLALEKIVKPNGVTFTNPDTENSFAFVGIKNNQLVSEGINISQATVILPITNQTII